MVETTLDPADWAQFRRVAHDVLDQLISYIENVESRPAWQPVPEEVKRRHTAGLPEDPQDLATLCSQISTDVLPYATGNIHPRFFGWVHGAGTADGLIAAMFVAAMNSNVGGRDHAAVYVERQVMAWFRELVCFPSDASGLLVTGTSTGTLVALAAAREKVPFERRHQLRVYASAEAHLSVRKALKLLGLPDTALCVVEVDERFAMSIPKLRASIAEDRARGLLPFGIVGTAGSTSTGALDDLRALAEVSAAEKTWFHVDAAIGIATLMHPRLRHLVDGIDRADSVSFDCHKWMQAQYDVGGVLVRDGEAHRRAFSAVANYLPREQRGTAGGDPWFCDFGPELSRGFRALKVWLLVSTHGTRALGEVVYKSHLQAQRLAELVAGASDMELLAPHPLSTVCFRFAVPDTEGPDKTDQLNRDIVITLQERGIAVPSLTTVRGKVGIRVNITNHRTTMNDIVELFDRMRQVRNELGG